MCRGRKGRASLFGCKKCGVDGFFFHPACCRGRISEKDVNVAAWLSSGARKSLADGVLAQAKQEKEKNDVALL